MANEFHLKRIEVMPRTDLKEVGDRLLAPFKEKLDERERIIRDDCDKVDELLEMLMEMAAGTDVAEWRDGPMNCSEVGCCECEDEDCRCKCHVRHSWTDIGRDEPEGMEADHE